MANRIGENDPTLLALLGVSQLDAQSAATGAGTVTSVNINSPNSTITVGGGPVTTTGTLTADLPTSGVTAGSYTSTDITVDKYGRVTKAASGAGGGTVTHTGTLTANALILGNGSADVTALGSLGTTGQTLRGVTSGAPVWQSFRGCLAALNADQTGQNYSTGGQIPFDGADTYDTDSIHDPVTNNTRLTVPSGVTWVRISASVLFTSVASDADLFFNIIKNGALAYFAGAPQFMQDTSSTAPRAAAITAPLNVSGGDYFELRVDSPGDNSITVAQAGTWFAMEIIQ